MLYASPGSAHSPTILSSRGSFFWRSILTLRPLFHSCSQFEMVSGRDKSFWYDGWAGQPLLPASSRPHLYMNISLFEARSIALQLLPLPPTWQMHLTLQKLQNFNPQSGSDKFLWTISASGRFTVSSVYRILSQAGKTRSLFTSIWKANVTPTMKCFFFLLLNNRLLTQQVMLTRHLPHTPGCVMCSDSALETSLHLFFQCNYARQVWFTLSATIGYQILKPKDTPALTYLASLPSGKQNRKTWLPIFICATWFLWRERNARIFRQASVPSQILSNRILQEAYLCTRYC